MDAAIQQPMRPATVGLGGYNRMPRRLQPYVTEVAAVCQTGCSRTPHGLQPYATRAAAAWRTDEDGEDEDARGEAEVGAPPLVALQRAAEEEADDGDEEGHLRECSRC